jgi:hypothetical protein
MILICAPDLINADAAECRSVCRPTPESPARSAMPTNALSAFLGSVGVPICVGNTKSGWSSQGCQTGAASRSAACVTLWWRSISATGEGSGVCREDFSVFG